jgi:hypothetical protein
VQPSLSHLHHATYTTPGEWLGLLKVSLGAPELVPCQLTCPQRGRSLAGQVVDLEIYSPVPRPHFYLCSNSLSKVDIQGAGGIAPVYNMSTICLPSKRETLNSNPSITP